MTLWLDEQLSPTLADWIARRFGIDATSVRDLGLKSATDRQIFLAGRAASTIVMSKDLDFVRLLDIHGPPPKVIWITCGNTSNARMVEILEESLPDALALLARGESMVEIGDAR